MRLYLVDYPRYVPYEEYEKAIDRMIKKLISQSGVISIYQIGSISNPGISDIDLVVVFEDNIDCHLDILHGLSKTERYLFKHDLYGVCQKHFYSAQLYSFFHNYKLLYGKNLFINERNFSLKDVAFLKNQIALEYIIRTYIDMTIERTYGIVRVRNLLLHIKALRYDLDFLSIFSGKLYDCIETLIGWRDNWFESKPNSKRLKRWIDGFYEELTKFLINILRAQKFRLPVTANLPITKNVKLVSSEQLDYTHKGVTLPAIFGGLGKKYFNIQHRFNRFEFKVPFTNNHVRILQVRYNLMNIHKMYNKKYLKNFAPILISPLNVIG